MFPPPPLNHSPQLAVRQRRGLPSKTIKSITGKSNTLRYSEPLSPLTEEAAVVEPEARQGHAAVAEKEEEENEKEEEEEEEEKEVAATTYGKGRARAPSRQV